MFGKPCNHYPSSPCTLQPGDPLERQEFNEHMAETLGEGALWLSMSGGFGGLYSSDSSKSKDCKCLGNLVEKIWISRGCSSI